MGDLSEDEMDGYLAHMELELVRSYLPQAWLRVEIHTLQNSATFFVGLGHIYHTGNIHAPAVIRRLANLRSFDQLRDITSISDIVSDPSTSEDPMLLHYESDWWSRFPEGSTTEVAVTPQVIFEGWVKQKSMLPAIDHPSMQVKDTLDLLPLSRQDLHSAYRTAEQLLQEAAMESITTLQHIKTLDSGLAYVEGLLREVQHIELETGET